MRPILNTAAAFILLSSTAWAQLSEKLDRGLVAMRQADGGVYVGWRLACQ